jgi:hypothetical protein
MKRITSLALSAALLASLSTPVLAAPAISVDAAPTAAVLEEENSLWELPQADTPDMSNTVWSFAGGYIDGSEMTQAEMDESLAAYGGTLQFTFDAAGGAKMIQGGGTLNGTYQYLDFAAELKGVKKADRPAQVQSAARRTGLEDVLPRLIRSLSKGYRQRVGVSKYCFFCADAAVFAAGRKKSAAPRKGNDALGSLVIVAITYGRNAC